MLFKKKTNWNLLAKYVAGETNSKESEAVKLWADKSPANQALLREIKSDWQMMDSMDDRFNVDVAWNKLHSRITGEQGRVVEMPGIRNRRINYSLPVRIAASIVLLAILGLAVVTTTSRLQRVTVANESTTQNRVVKLPDGSTVHLNNNTKLNYSKKFGKNNRDITLTGEAYFEVTPDTEKPFRIFAGNACVKVVGTSFNVNTRNTKGTVEVYVESGLVELSENGNQKNSIMLHPGNMGVISQKSLKSIQAENTNCLAWKTRSMTFTDTPLLEVISLLNDVYNVNIKAEGEGIDTVRINGSYENDQLDDILRVISQHNPQLTIAKSDDTIYLSQ